MRLDRKVAIVTGANGEFGSAIVPGFAKEGCEIACVDWTEDDANTAAAKVQAFGRRSLALGVDLRDSTQVETMVRRVVDEFGKVDILVNTTARPHHQEFFGFPEEDFDDTLARGVKSYFLTCKAVAQYMTKQRSGKIINLTSIVSKLGPGQAPDWSADRGAVDGLTRSVAHALGFYGINVNGVARGNTARPPYSVGVQERIRRLPFGRTEDPRDMVAHNLPGDRRQPLHHRHRDLRGWRLYRRRGHR